LNTSFIYIYIIIVCLIFILLLSKKLICSASRWVSVFGFGMFECYLWFWSGICYIWVFKYDIVILRGEMITISIIIVILRGEMITISIIRGVVGIYIVLSLFWFINTNI